MDRIDLLEDKVRELIGTMTRLREENNGLRTQLSAAQSELQSAADEHSLLDQERAEVRGRIERLLGDLDDLDPGTVLDARAHATTTQGAGTPTPPAPTASAVTPTVTPSTNAPSLAPTAAQTVAPAHVPPPPRNPVLPGLG